MGTEVKHRLAERMFHLSLCSDPGEEAIKAINNGGEDWLFCTLVYGLYGKGVVHANVEQKH